MRKKEPLQLSPDYVPIAGKREVGVLAEKLKRLTPGMRAANSRIVAIMVHLVSLREARRYMMDAGALDKEVRSLYKVFNAGKIFNPYQLSVAEKIIELYDKRMG